MNSLILIIVMALSSAHSGWASYYDKAPTDATIRARISMEHIPDKKYDVYVAVSDCSRIGETGLISIDGHAPVPYIVFDCAGLNAYEDGQSWMDKHNIAVELDYYTTERYVPCRCGAWVELWPTSR